MTNLFPNKWILHYDKAPVRTALSVKEFLAKDLIMMSACFLDCKRILHREFIPPGQTLNQKFRPQDFERLKAVS
jgi:hypothetical protein